MAINFDTYDPTHLSGTFQINVLDADMDPNHVLESTKDYYLDLDWVIQGIGAPGLGGEWRVSVYLESMGPGYEGQVAAIVYPMSLTPPIITRHFHEQLKIPANSAPNGVYKLVVTLRHFNQNVAQRTAAFAEGPLIELYTP